MYSHCATLHARVLASLTGAILRTSLAERVVEPVATGFITPSVSTWKKKYDEINFEESHSMNEGSLGSKR